jgi:hypothetical protein
VDGGGKYPPGAVSDRGVRLGRKGCMKPVRCLLPLGLLAIGACGFGREADVFNPTPEFALQLKEKALELAQSEMKKFMAVELTYKDQVTFNAHVLHPTNPTGGVYYKGYRQFTGCRVNDIRRNDSLLHPITVEIVYEYDLITTKAYHSDLPDAKEKAAKETEYRVEKERQVTRRYPCDAYGNYDGKALPDVPPPDNVFSPGKELVPDPMKLLIGRGFPGQRDFRSAFALPPTC